jgi:dTDP-4-dehydrorhamnose reductase
MRILLTGADGQLGTAIKSLCASERVIVCDATDLAQLDITNLQRVRRFVESCKPDFIVNCAAYNDVDAAEDSNRFDDVCLVNSIGPRNLAIASDEFKIPLMHFSTDYVFDGAKNTPYQITDLPHPINIYGGSKLLGESFVRSLTKMHFVVRLSWLFGPSGFNFVTKVSDWAKTSTEIRIVDDQTSCPCYTEDIAPAAIDLLESKAYGLYHMTNSG